MAKVYEKKGVVTVTHSGIRRRDLVKGALVLSIAPGLPAWGATPRRGGVLRLSVDQAVANLNPLLARVRAEYLVAECLYSGLTRLASDMSAVPDLAESWSASADLTTWTFRLRANLTFHDGSRLTAADVVATFEALLDKSTGSPALENIGPIIDISAVDDRTAKFTLSMPYVDLPIALAYPNAKIIPAAFARGSLERLSDTAVGSGPFRLVHYQGARLVALERNPDYYHHERPYLDEVEIVVYPDYNAGVSALKTGDTDLILSLPAAEFAYLNQLPGVEMLRTRSGRFCNVIMRTDQRPFHDMRVRRALALAVDRPAMVSFVANSFGQVGNDSPLNSVYAHYESLPLRQRNVQKAKELLREAGYPKGLRLELVASDTPFQRISLAVALRAMAGPAGFVIDIRTMPHATYLAQVWKKGAFYVGFYNGQATADSIFSLMYTADAPWNESGWENPDFDALVRAAQSTTDQGERSRLIGRAQRIIYEEIPTIIPTFLDLLAAKRNYVKGFTLNPRGAVFDLDCVWIKK